MMYTAVQKLWDHKICLFFFFKEMYTFIQQGCIKLIKCDGKYIYLLTGFFLFQINTVLSKFLFIKES